MPHSTRRIFLLFLGLAAAAGLVLGFVEVFSAARRSLGALAGVGYAGYLRVDPSDSMRFLFACLQDGACTDNFGKAWGYYYNYWYILAGVAATFAFFVMHLVKGQAKRELDPATGRWSTVKDLKARGYLEDPKNPEQRGYVGVHPSGRMIRVPERIRFSHTLVIGGPGARKSTGYHWQNILSDAKDGWSVIIFDLKYPDPKGGFVAALPYFESLGYNVQLFAPYDDFTHHLPIIQAATEERVAREIAEMIIPPDPAAGGAEFYRNNERRLISGLLMHAAANNISLNELHEVMQRGAQGLQRFITGQKLDGQGNSTTYGKASEKVRTITSSLFEADPKEQAGLITGMEGKIQFFADERLGRATRTAPEPWLNIDLSKLGTEKTILYVGIPQKHIDTGSGKLLLQLIKRMIDSALSETAYQNGGELPVPVSFYLDEFPSLGKLPNVESNFATMRSRRVAYHLTIQNISQGKAIYGDAGFKSFFTSNFQTILLFPSFIKFEDAQYMSQILGSTMTTMTGESETKGGQHNSSSHSLRESTRPLVTVDEMQTWPPNEGIAILNGVPHTHVIVPGIWEESSGGVKNPFKATYDKLDQNLDIREYATNLIKRSRAGYLKEALAPYRHDAMVRLRQLKANRDREELKGRQQAAAAAKRAADVLAAARTVQKADPQAPAPTSVPAAVTQPASAASAPLPAPVPAPTATTELVTVPEERPATAPGSNKYHRVNPKKALNRLASHIVQAQADVRVKGERARKEVHEIRVPATLVKQHLFDDEIEYLEKQGTLTNRGTFYRVNQDGIQVLDEQWYRFFTKQLPVVTNKQRYNRREVEEALRAQIAKLIADEVQVNVRINGGTGEIERLDFNAWNLDTDARTKYQVGWGAHNLLRLEAGQAVIRAAGVKLLTNDQAAYFLELKRQQQALATEAQPVDAAVEPATPREATPSEEGQPKPRPRDNGPAATPRAPQPRAERAERKPKSPSHGQRQRPQKPAKPATPPAPVAPEGVAPARAPKAAAAPNPVADQAPGELPRFEYVLDASREAHVVRLARDEDLARLREWAERSKELIHNWPAQPPPKHPLGVLDKRTLLVSRRFMSKLETPRVVPAVKAQSGVKVAGKTFGDVFPIDAGALNSSTEWTVWAEANGERIPGHPRYEGQDPLPGVAYKQQVLSVAKVEAEALFGHEFPSKVITTGGRTEMVRFFLPDD